MILVTDIGNSNIVIGLHDGNKWIRQHRIETIVDQPSLYYQTLFRDILLEWRIAVDDICRSVISSVVPPLTESFSLAIKNNIRIQSIVLNPEVFISLDMVIPKVYEIGSDLVANAYATKEVYACNAIIVDFGTALTFTVYDHGYGIKGVTIAPGLKTIISTLSGKTSQLPKIEIVLPSTAIGTSTSTAIQAGVIFGFIGSVKEILKRIKSELDSPYIVIATGGLSTALEELLPEYDKINKDLTIEGIRLIPV